MTFQKLAWSCNILFFEFCKQFITKVQTYYYHIVEKLAMCLEITLHLV
jgi:hypothetical protein